MQETTGARGRAIRLIWKSSEGVSGALEGAGRLRGRPHETSRAAWRAQTALSLAR